MPNDDDFRIHKNTIKCTYDSVDCIVSGYISFCKHLGNPSPNVCGSIEALLALSAFDVISLVFFALAFSIDDIPLKMFHHFSIHLNGSRFRCPKL